MGAYIPLSIRSTCFMSHCCHCWVFYCVFFFLNNSKSDNTKSCVRVFVMLKLMCDHIFAVLFLWDLVSASNLCTQGMDPGYNALNSQCYWNVQFSSIKVMVLLPLQVFIFIFNGNEINKWDKQKLHKQINKI